MARQTLLQRRNHLNILGTNSNAVSKIRINKIGASFILSVSPEPKQNYVHIITKEKVLN